MGIFSTLEFHFLAQAFKTQLFTCAHCSGVLTVHLKQKITYTQLFRTFTGFINDSFRNTQPPTGIFYEDKTKVAMLACVKTRLGLSDLNIARTKDFTSLFCNHQMPILIRDQMVKVVVNSSIAFEFSVKRPFYRNKLPLKFT